MCIEAEWLKNNIQGYRYLSEDERKVLKYFPLLWSVFEAKALGKRARPDKILEVACLWNDKGLVELKNFKEELDYFRVRFLTNDEANNRFEHLRFSKPANKELVINVLKNQENDIEKIVGAILLIIYRLRNNYFHGEKWAYQFRSQFENFKNANILLMKFIDINSKL